MTIAAFLTDVSTLLKTGSATEHSYRAALGALFTTVLKVEAINEPKHEKYGAPDFVINRGSTPIGHVEAKDVGIRLDSIIKDSQAANSKTTNAQQLKRYRAALPNLLYTDGLIWYWFVDGELRHDQPVVVATWNSTTKKLTPTPTGVADLGQLLTQFGAQDVATVSKPRDLAQRLARTAHWLRDVIVDVFESQTSQGELHQQLEAFRKTLLPGLAPAEFADMYAQTIVYGLFAARVSQPTKTTFTRFDAARAIPKTNPFLRSLFQQIAGYDLDDNIAWLVDDCAALLAHTDMAEVMRDFGRATRQEDPVVHFYETFLAAYDPKMREARGVYYTPEPVVSFIVRSVHSILQTHFNKPMGLADEHAIILDPATGTATFLNTVVQHIHQELADQGLAGTWDQYVPEKLLNRVFGFELLMAPYTIAHLKLGLTLQQLGYTFGSNQRLGVYLTNTLSDAPPTQQAFAFAQRIAEEGHAANEVKHNKEVMVVLGNPPYSGVSANNSPWITDLLRGKLPAGGKTENYYEVDGGPLGERNPKWLQDDYVKFIRFGEWRIAQSGEGVLAFISNNGYLDNPTFRGMRESLLKDFDTIYILNLHGNSKKRERSPDGGADENVFDIQQGVAIGIFIKKAGSSQQHATVYYADLWGEREDKYASLAKGDLITINWQELKPNVSWYLFIPQSKHLYLEYADYVKVSEVFPVNSAGIVTARDSLSIHWNKQNLIDTIQDFSELDVEEARSKYHLGADTRDWQVHLAKADLKDKGIKDKFIQKIIYRPFDERYTYYTGRTKGFLCMPRSEVMYNMIRGQNVSLVGTRQTRDTWGVSVSQTIIGHKAFAAYDINSLFPLYIYPNIDVAEPMLFDSPTYAQPNQRRANLSPTFVAAFAERLGLTWIDDGKGDLVATFGPEDVFHYAYAVFHSPTYRERYAEFLKIDFPRLPLTSDQTLFRTLVQLGAQLVDLHLLRLPGAGGVGGAGGAKILQSPGKQGMSFPTGGSSTVEKITYVAPLDEQPGEVRINATQKFTGVEPETWAMQIGGYQPLEKWLKDRKGRTLSTDDISHYMRMVIALRETRRLMGEIDAAMREWPIK